MDSMLIKNGTLYLSSGKVEADILVRDGKIQKIGHLDSEDADAKLDATGKIVIPGLIDGHTHMDFPFMNEVTADDFYYGTTAAVAGGVTTIIDFITPSPNEKLLSAYSKWRNKADSKVVSDFGLHCIIRDASVEILSDVHKLIEEGVTSFKLFLAYKNEFMMDDASLFRTIKTVSENGGTIAIHAENGNLVEELTNELLKHGKTGPVNHYFSRPESLEIEATNRIAVIASLVGKHVRLYIVHTSTKEAVEIMRGYRENGYMFYNETTPNYLTYDYKILEKANGYRYIMSPPFRREEEVEGLWNHLRLNNIFTVGSDHCAYSDDQKMRHGKVLPPFNQIPNGTPGTETILPLLFTNGVKKGRITMEQLVSTTSKNPSILFGLEDKKGDIKPGLDADLVIIDPKKEKTVTPEILHSNLNYTILEGTKLAGWPTVTILRGEVVYENGELKTKKGSGKYLKRSPLFITTEHR